LSASPSSAADRAAPADPTAPRPRSLRRNMVYAVAGNVFFNLCRFGVVVILAKFATVELQGQYNYAIALTSPIILFFTFNLRGAYVSDARGQFTFGTYHTFRTVGMVLAAIGAAIVIALDLAGVSLNPFGGTSAPPATASWTYAAILICVAVSKIIGTATDLIWGVYQRRERLEQWRGPSRRARCSGWLRISFTTCRRRGGIPTAIRRGPGRRSGGCFSTRFRWA